MECEICGERAISSSLERCERHFIDYVHETVRQTISRWNLLQDGARVIVAVSGGKDSLTTLDILDRLGYSVTALFVDEGISGYSEHLFEDLTRFCKDRGISYKKIGFKQEFGFTQDEAVATGVYHPCTICGTLRRYLLNKHAAGYDALVTGHNLDDESQTIMINIFRANTRLFTRPGLASEPSRWFVRKIKPLYFLTEKQVLIYTLLTGIRTQSLKCPYMKAAYRASMREELNQYEASHPGTKRNIVETHSKIKSMFLSSSQKTDADIGECERCGQASNERLCKACQMQQTIRRAIGR